MHIERFLWELLHPWAVQHYPRLHRLSLLLSRFKMGLLFYVLLFFGIIIICVTLTPNSWGT